ncbi:MAG: dipeptide epimerase [Calditrichia bacterium]
MTHTAGSRLNLKITSIRIYRLNLARKDVFTIATMSLDKVENVLIQIQTDEGIVGWGEASPFHALVGETQLIGLAAARELRDFLIGKNPLEIASLVKQMDEHLPHNPTIKSAFDMALYDIAAKAAGLPLWAFLGGTMRPLETDFTISIGHTDEAGEKAKTVCDMGFRMIKVKVGINEREDLLRLQNIRKAVGDKPLLRIDANQGWDRITAVNSLRRFEDLGVQFCEQPCRATDMPGMKYVSHNSTIPVMADESLFSPYDALTLIKEDAVTYFNIKLSKSGGILNGLKIAHIAEAGSRLCMIGCMSESRLGLTASAHLALASPAFRFYDLDSFVEHAEDPVIGGVTLKNGMVQFPDGPGLGAEPDPAFLKKLEEVK